MVGRVSLPAFRSQGIEVVSTVMRSHDTAAMRICVEAMRVGLPSSSSTRGVWSGVGWGGDTFAVPMDISAISWILSQNEMLGIKSVFAFSPTYLEIKTVVGELRGKGGTQSGHG